MKKFVLVLLFMGLVVQADAYSISGSVVAGSQSEGIRLAFISLYQNGKVIKSTETGYYYGYFSFSGLSSGSYQVVYVPEASVYEDRSCTFTPSSINVTITNWDVNGIDFTGTCSGAYCREYSDSYDCDYSNNCLYPCEDNTNRALLPSYYAPTPFFSSGSCRIWDWLWGWQTASGYLYSPYMITVMSSAANQTDAFCVAQNGASAFPRNVLICDKRGFGQPNLNSCEGSGFINVATSEELGREQLVDVGTSTDNNYEYYLITPCNFGTAACIPSTSCPAGEHHDCDTCADPCQCDITTPPECSSDQIPQKNADGCYTGNCIVGCIDGATQSCYDGPILTEGIGNCQAGTQTCANGQWGSCQGEVLPGDLLCGEDNNCDGTPDEQEGACQCSTQLTNYSTLNAASGNLSHSEDLFSVKGTGLTASMTLYYRSLNNYSGSLGRKWTHTYDMNLTEIYDGSIIFNDGTGTGRFYTKNGSDYISQPGDYSTLAKNADNTFVITQKDGLVYNFDQNGKITSMVDRNGNTMTFSYTNGNLSTVTDPAGRVVTFSYDANNRITGITAPGGAAYTLTYTNSMLTSVTNPDGGQWNYTYDGDGLMLTKTDPNNNTTTYTYDNSGREISATNAEGNVKAMSYDPANKTSQMTEEDGGVWKYKYDTNLGVMLQKTDPLGNVTSYAYDEDKNMLSNTAPDGSTTSYTYDDSGNMTSVTDPLNQTTTYTYNSFGQVTSVTDPQGNNTSYTYDANGKLQSTTDPTGSTTTYQYDSKGNITGVTNSAGQTTSFTYDQYNNIASITDPTGATTKFTYDTNGNLTSQTDANGNTTSYAYDSLNHLLSVTDSAGNTTTYTYDKNGNKISMTDANSNTTYYAYNSEGELIQTKDALGNITTYAYGGTGCPSCGGGNGDKLTSITDANGNTISYQYDQSGRKIKDIDAMGNATSYSYDSRGNLLSRTDANGHVTYYAYDPLNRMTSQTDPLNGVVSFSYAPNGQLTKVTDALGNATGYEHDAAGRVTKAVSPDTGTTTYTYNVTGTLATKTDANGITINYLYDSLNRVTQIQFPDSSQNVTYTYDSCTNGKGHVCSFSDPSGTTAYTYDTLGRIVKESKTILGVAYNTSYTYDKAGNMTMITYPSGRQVNYNFDKLHRATGVTENLTGSVNIAGNIVYDAVSNMKSITFGNGVTLSLHKS